MITEEITRRLATLKQAAQEFAQMTNMVDGNFETRLNEIKAMEAKRDKVKEDLKKAQDKANTILQNATEQSAVMVNEAKKLLEDAQNQRQKVKYETEVAQNMKAEATALFAQATEKQKTADAQFFMLEERKKRLEAAIR